MNQKLKQKILKNNTYETELDIKLEKQVKAKNITAEQKIKAFNILKKVHRIFDHKIGRYNGSEIDLMLNGDAPWKDELSYTPSNKIMPAVNLNLVDHFQRSS